MSVLGGRMLAIHDALAEANLPHAIGGAIALGFCTLEPRATRDLDLNVFVGPERIQDVFAALPSEIRSSRSSVEEAERDGQVRLWWGDTPIDVFFSVLPFHAEAARTVRHVPFMGQTIPVVGCNALAVFKAIFDRTRHWADIEAMIEANAIDIDEAAARVREIDGAASASASRLLSLKS
jgi:hypothetical protein